ncbi:MAG: Gfo/Idh/MocA family oxidoreductase [Verrucomicrobiae bacterium]|nr:Gfo/Idh/MocA family oxidoreductase [Verrucomicrobiae bacterium]
MKRRQFLQRSAGAASGVLGFPAILRSASPNSKLQVASIGVGGMGGNTMKSVATHPAVQIVAVCDVDQKTLEVAAKSFAGSVAERDWRELFAKHADRFDAVTIGTPDHSHAAPAVTALRAGKHVYLQKPMASTLHECRVVTEEAAKAGVVTQLGNQGRSTVESRLTVEMIRGGVIGKIKEVLLWENKKLNWWPKNTELRSKADALPEGFDWDLWLGVRGERPYLADTYHPKSWRAWFDFGVGEMGDMGCHHFDTTFDALKLTAPIKVRQTTPGSTGPLWGEQRIVELVFPGTDMTAGDTVKLTWHDGELRPDASRITLPKEMATLPESGTFWIGEHGAIFKSYRGGRPIVVPESLLPTEKYPADPKPQNHYHDWVDAILEGRKSIGDFSHGGPLSETVLAGAMADRFAGDWLDWDRKTQTFTNHPEATKLVRRAYREGWRVNGLG